MINIEAAEVNLINFSILEWVKLQKVWILHFCNYIASLIKPFLTPNFHFFQTPHRRFIMQAFYKEIQS